MCQKKNMRKRSNESLSEEPPRKRISPGGNVLPILIPSGEVLTDLTGKKWKIGKTLGHGGFGDIYLASDNLKEPVKNDTSYVIKVESHKNGPLFVEINCLLRIARQDMIRQWQEERGIKSLGMPHYIASGSHTIGSEKLRFLVIPRFEQDLEKIFVSKQRKFNLKTVILICSQIIDILEYVHSKGYVHCDIKASNILHSLQKLEKLQTLQTQTNPINTSATHQSLQTPKKVCKPIRSCRIKQPVCYCPQKHQIQSTKIDQLTKIEREIVKAWIPPYGINLAGVGKRTKNLRPKKTINYNESVSEIIEISDTDSSDSENKDNEEIKSLNSSCAIISPPTKIKNSPNIKNHTNIKNPTNLKNPTKIKNSTKIENQIYLFDYGLATKFRHSDGRHKQYCNDERKAHAGTILFCSLDAHLGASSRRSDLETLGYNIIYWLTSDLPWSKNINDPETVQKTKQECFANLDVFLKSCFTNCPNFIDCPTFIDEYFQYVKSLTFEAKPDYAYCKKLLQKALFEYGYKSDGKFDFDNLEGWGQKPKKLKVRKSENFLVKRKVKKIDRPPLTSNIQIKKHVLRRRESKKLRKKKLNWSKILSDPEEILRQNNKQKNHEVSNKRERTFTDSSDTSCYGITLHNMDIYELNPTYAMLEVFNKYRDRNSNYSAPAKNGKGEGCCNEHRKGYTPAMNQVLSKMYRNKLEEFEKNTNSNPSKNKSFKKTRSLNMVNKKNSNLKRTKSTVIVNNTREVKRKSKPVRGYILKG